MSVGHEPLANGCTVGSSRHSSSVKPKHSRIARPNSFWLSTGKQLALQFVEDLADFRSFHLLLEVVEEDVVHLVPGVEAFDVAVLQLDVLLEIGEEGLEVGLPARVDPG